MFSVICLDKACFKYNFYVLGGGAPNELLKGTPIPSTGAGRKGP